MSLLERVKTRLPGEDVSDDILSEYIATISDRLLLRLSANTLPSPFDSIVVDAVVKMHRRSYYEGISSESSANINTSFVDDILNEYSDEINRWVANKKETDCFGERKKVMFL